MLDAESKEEVRLLVRSTQIIVFALCCGLTVFGVIVLFVTAPPLGRELRFLNDASVGLALVFVALRVIVPQLMVVRRRRSLDQHAQRPDQPHLMWGLHLHTEAGQLAAIYQATTIVAGGLLEAPAFFSLIAFMLTRSLIPYLVACLLLTGMLFLFPTQTQFEGWVERQLRLIADEQSLRPR